jgi:uncharacterized ion transporter superfamily protein YfcC
MSDVEQTSLRIGKTAFLLAFFILLGLMIVSGVLTHVVSPGSFERVEQDGRVVVVPGSYAPTDVPPAPVWRWFAAPVEVLFAEGNIVVLTIIAFLLFVGGAFAILEAAGVLTALINRIVERFRRRRYLLMAIVIFFFMAVASILGVYEAMVPMIVLIVPLAHRMGWDSLTGLGMSLLPLAFGFSAAITNPFTIGVAQRIAELPLFSGAWLRIMFFVLVYAVVLAFVALHARRIERDPRRSLVYDEDRRLREREGFDAERAAAAEAKMGRPTARALRWFAAVMAVAFAFIFATARTPGLSDLAFPVMALLFLAGGVGSGLLAGMGPRRVAAAFGRGAVAILPGVVLILMSLSVRYIVDLGGITDTILHGATRSIGAAGPFASAFLIYLVTLGMNFFVGSASAKAFLMMPILAPLADLAGVTRQTAVLAFDFGDGFSNMIYPSNALLLIGLSFTVVSYPRWIRWTLPLQVLAFALSMAFLAIAVAVEYGPF